MNRAEVFVHKCYSCGGVEFGPNVDDGIIEDELYTWACQNCGNEREFHEEEPYAYIDAWGVKWMTLFRKAQNAQYSDFMEWAKDTPDSPDEV